MLTWRRVGQCYGGVRGRRLLEPLDLEGLRYPVRAPELPVGVIIVACRLILIVSGCTVKCSRFIGEAMFRR